MSKQGAIDQAYREPRKAGKQASKAMPIWGRLHPVCVDFSARLPLPRFRLDVLTATRQSDDNEVHRMMSEEVNGIVNGLEICPFTPVCSLK